MMINYTADSY